MGTTVYFEGTLKNQYERDGGEVEFAAGTTGFLGNGPQLYINIDDKVLIIDHDTASKLCNALGRIGGYLGYGSEGEG